jgi:hypothetical protein
MSLWGLAAALGICEGEQFAGFSTNFPISKVNPKLLLPLYNSYVHLMDWEDELLGKDIGTLVSMVDGCKVGDMLLSCNLYVVVVMLGWCLFQEDKSYNLAGSR